MILHIVKSQSVQHKKQKERTNLAFEGKAQDVLMKRKKNYILRDKNQNGI